MVRGVVDECGLYDTIPGGEEGVEGVARQLWIEVTPQSFNVRVREGVALTQLMVLRSFDGDAPADEGGTGDTGDTVDKGDGGGGLVLAATTASTGYAPSILKDVTKGRADNLVYDHAGNPLPLHLHREALVLSLSVPSASEVGVDGVIGYEARPTNEVIDLSKKGHYRPSHFFREGESYYYEVYEDVY